MRIAMTQPIAKVLPRLCCCLVLAVAMAWGAWGVAHAADSGASGTAGMPPADPAQPAFDAKEAESGAGKKTEKNLHALENQVTDAAKDAVKKLGSSSLDMTLEDLNSARTAVAKINAIIEVEKSLSELDKIRDERAKDNPVQTPVVIPQLPAAAVQPPPPPMPMIPQPVMFPQPVMPDPMPSVAPKKAEPSSKPIEKPQPEVAVERVVGANGTYSAVLSVNGDARAVRVGDRIADVGVVVNITVRGVDVVRDGETHHYFMKGAGIVRGERAL